MALGLNWGLNHCFPSLSKHLHGCFCNNLPAQSVFLLIQQYLEVRITGETILVESLDRFIQHCAVEVFGAVCFRRVGLLNADIKYDAAILFNPIQQSKCCAS